ncbi:MAG: acyl-CoA/acyl-ACP dehydrogenase [Deltaproteobacteria bacterium]|nr:acyl-CoA/acyl-ACP dehydrogenase [Deltaproteobacteria bacterium]
MSALISNELKILHEMASDFALQELAPKWEHNDEYPFKPLYTDVLKKAYETGFFGVMMSEEQGGFNRSIKALCIVLNDICKIDASLGGTIFTNALVQEIMTNAGETDLLSSLVSKASSFENILVAFPSFDNSEDISIMVKAKKNKDNKYVLNGSTDYVALGGIARQALIPVIIDGQDDYSLFMVSTNQPGVKCSKPVVSIGLHACPAVDMIFHNAQAVLVGKEKDGKKYFNSAADRMSVASAAMAAGVVRSSFNVALDYSKQRTQGGREIKNWSVVRMMLSSMAVNLQCADLAISSACSMVDEQESGWQLASRAVDLFVTEMACDVTSVGIQVLGGNGYMHDYTQEKGFRDARQIQALMGMAPMRKLAYIKQIIEG